LKKILNLGILAHVDAGKTTLTENLLFLCGETKMLGSVDDKTSCSDILPVERARGISVKSSVLSVSWGDSTINIIDTPGHADFSGDVERALQAVDVVLLVVSAVEGIQAQTEIILKALEKAKLPFCIFINKVDRIGADNNTVFDKLSNEFQHKKFLKLSEVDNEGSREAVSKLIFTEQSVNENAIELLCEADDYLLSRYLEGEVPNFSVLSNVFKREFQAKNLVPVLAGAAMSGEGVEDLLNFFNNYCSKRFITKEEQPEFQVVNLTVTEKEGKKAAVRVLKGKLKTRDIVNVFDNEEKISKLEKLKGFKVFNCNELATGEVGFVYGLKSLKAGDRIGGKQTKKLVALPSVLSVQVKSVDNKNFPKLAEALFVLNDEDPELNFQWDKVEKTLTINIRGIIQVEVLKQILLDRFSLETEFSPPEVIYKETVLKKGYGFAEYTMPKPCWAVLKFMIEPLTINEGIEYSSVVSTDKIQKKYQNEVAQTIDKALKQGPLGWEVTDLKITLIEGEDHTVHSNPGDFKLATPMGIMDGLVNCKTTLLEPVASFKITAPEDFAGKIINDLLQMRGDFQQPVTHNGKVELKGQIPVSTSLEYGITLSSMTGGRGYFSTQFKHYQKCELENGKARPFKGINPLDKSKYILHMRSAIK